MDGTAAIGRAGEELACQYLMGLGMQILARNWRCAGGELDIVARDGRTVVFCEVKTRTGTSFGTPVEAVTPAKAARLRRLAVTWLMENGPHRGAVRIDVVGIVMHAGGPPRLQHLRGVS